MIAADVVEQGEAVGAGHQNVGEDEVIVGILLEAEYGFFGAFCCGCSVAAALKQGGYSAAHEFFVVDYEDSILWHRSLIGRFSEKNMVWVEAGFCDFWGVLRGVAQKAAFFCW